MSDTVVLRVTSPHAAEIAFSGVIVLKDAKTERRIDNARTPFELRLPAQDIDASFRASDFGGLSGEIIALKDGKQRGHVQGTMYIGSVKLHFESGGSFGLGGRQKREPIP